MAVKRARALKDSTGPEITSDSSSDEGEVKRPKGHYVRVIRYVEGHSSRCHVAFAVLLSILAMVSGCSLLAMRILSALDNDYYVAHETWSKSEGYYKESVGPLRSVKHVIFAHTATETCASFDNCSTLLIDLKSRVQRFEYNFLVSSADFVYEGIGWHRLSRMYQNIPGVVVAFIGNYTELQPTPDQFRLVNHMFLDAIRSGKLHSKYTVVGKKPTNGSVPRRLFQVMKETSKWDNNLSDEF